MPAQPETESCQVIKTFARIETPENDAVAGQCIHEKILEHISRTTRDRVKPIQTCQLLSDKPSK